MNSDLRLKSYGVFRPEVIESVSRVADQQNQHSFAELADTYGLADGPSRTTLYENEYEHTVEYLSLTPVSDHHRSDIRLYFTPMATPIDQNMAVRAMRLFATVPDKPMLVVGAPAAIGNRANRLPYKDLPAVWKGSVTPAVRPISSFLLGRNICDVDVMGYSYGAERAVDFVGAAHEVEIDVTRSVIVEPPSVTKRSMLSLLKDFQASGKALDAYIEAAGSRPLNEARELSDVGLLRYIGGLLRPNNIALAHAMSRGGLQDRLDSALSLSFMRATVAWGSKSELVDDAKLGTLVQEAAHKYGHNRVRPLRLPNMHHAGGDDIDLHAAIMLQGLKY